MKKFMVFLLLLVLVSPFVVLADQSTLDWSLTFAPPHNEPVIGDKVARYRLQLHPEWSSKFVRFSPEINAWGVNTWQTSDVVGHGVPDAWENSDWSVETVRISMTTRVELGPESIHLYAEHYMPINRESWGGHGLEQNVYFLLGIGGRVE